MDNEIKLICESEERLLKGLSLIEFYKGNLKELKLKALRNITNEKELEKHIDDSINSVKVLKSSLEKILIFTNNKLVERMNVLIDEMELSIKGKHNTFTFKFKTIEYNSLKLKIQIIKEFLEKLKQ